MSLSERLEKTLPLHPLLLFFPCSPIIDLHSLLRLVGYNKLRALGLWLRWIEQAPPEQLGTLEETLGVNVVKFGET